MCVVDELSSNDLFKMLALRVYFSGAEKIGHLTAEQFMEFLNQEQRDPRLNEILYPYYDVRKSQTLIDVIEGRTAAAPSAEHQFLQHDASENSSFNSESYYNSQCCVTLSVCT